ncbi:MAG: GNAT family N-acetyltransferase [Alphaproteobacteria bacterium]|nr:GNAT family N-acetyltransferase [Alphaproteobacteria bacterium]
MTVLATGRLMLRPLARGDLPALEGLFADRAHMWDLMDIPGRSSDPGDLARYYLERSLWAFERHGAGMWGMLEKDRNDAPIMGYTGFVMDIGDDVNPAERLEAGWAIARQAAGRGHAAEATERILEYAFVDLGTHSIQAITSPHNLASRRLMSRLGFTYDRDVVAYQGPQVLYTISRQDWLAGRRSPGHRGGVCRQASW